MMIKTRSVFLPIRVNELYCVRLSHSLDKKDGIVKPF